MRRVNFEMNNYKLNMNASVQCIDCLVAAIEFEFFEIDKIEKKKFPNDKKHAKSINKHVTRKSNK
ncbi:hypothetical protein T11_2403 [Trichinella zimbabwensis]|uniref:Uncharacterized protein n=1 Tax=Trichinella zimbabwensis TaxID=268475 RepID=A0A0V1HVZ2_9BILA|nr:hypothetical protein T11_2403 [Trichinella zimbabwensis]